MDITSVSNQAWQTFRLVYDQDVFSQMGALGFVMGNNKDSFIEIGFNNPNDSFDEVRILNDKQMAGRALLFMKPMLLLILILLKERLLYHIRFSREKLFRNWLQNLIQQLQDWLAKWKWN